MPVGVGSQLHLPPTPSDLERVELVQRSLALIRQSTDDIIEAVGTHAFSGFPEDVARKVEAHIAETATLCRRCKHCMTQCNPRAVAAMASGPDGTENLAAEAARATQSFEQVAKAAMSALSQVRPSAPAAIRQQLGEGGRVDAHLQQNWDELFSLSSSTSAAKSGSPLKPPTTPSSRAGGAADARGGEAGSAEPPRSARPRSRTAGKGPANSPGVQPTPPPQLQPPSAALSLWHARMQGRGGSTGGGASEGSSPACGSGSGACGADGDSNGAFALLESHAWTPALDTTPPRVAGAEVGAEAGERASGRGDRVPSMGELRASVEKLQRVTPRVHAVVGAHVWAGFSEEAEAELKRLQHEGRAAARSCRRQVHRAGKALE